MPRAGLSTASVVSSAAEIADTEGLEALTLARLASTAGVRTPSLYNHVTGLEDVRRRVALLALREVAAALREAAVGRAGDEALVAAAGAYRAYALRHPGRYAAIQRAPAEGDDEMLAAGAEAVGILLAILRGYGLDEEQTVHATRAVRSALHGFVTLEAAGGFGLPQSVDDSYARLVALLDSGLSRG